MLPNTPEKFWDRVDKSGGPNACWEWQGYKLPKGYGEVSFKGKLFRAHRLAYEFGIGPIPEGKLVLHKCDNPSCCNPKHLYLGTYLDNARDCIQRGRRREPDRRGSKNGRARFTEEQIPDIRNDSRSRKVIADDYGVTLATISDIKASRTWRHI